MARGRLCGHPSVQPRHERFERAHADASGLGVNDEQRFEFWLLRELSNQSQHVALIFKGIHHVEWPYLEANRVSQSRGFGKRADREVTEDRLGLLDELLRPSEHRGDDSIAIRGLQGYLSSHIVYPSPCRPLTPGARSVPSASRTSREKHVEKTLRRPGSSCLLEGRVSRHQRSHEETTGPLLRS